MTLEDQREDEGAPRRDRPPVRVMLEDLREKHTTSHWDLAERLSKILAGVLIPLVGVWIGWLIHVSGTNAEYLKQAVAELSKADVDPALRGWAVDVFKKTSPVPVGRDLEQALRAGKVNLRPQSSVFRPGSDLSELDLSAQDLSGLDLSKARLARANLKNTLLSRSNLSEVDLSGAALSGANLREADLRDALMDFADLRGALLTKANLKHASLRGTNLEGVDLRSVHGLEVEQLVIHELQISPQSYGGVSNAAKRAARWNSATRFPDTVRSKLEALGLLLKNDEK